MSTPSTTPPSDTAPTTEGAASATTSAGTTTTPANVSSELNQSLQEISDLFQQRVQVKDRRYRLTTYKSCFVGSEAVDVLVSSGMATSRDEAVQLGRVLATEFHLFEHVTRDHDFKDDSLFYRFTTAQERGALSINETTGKSVGWADFFLPATGSSSSSAEGGDGAASSMLPSFPQPDLTAISAKDAHVASQVWPLDEYNTTLLNNVHPPQWKDPAADSTTDGSSSSSYDLVVIGAGAGGLVTSAGAAGVGARVALIEEHFMGGDCLNVGCVPSKALIHSANLAHTLRGDASFLAEAGLVLDPAAVTIQFDKVMERVRKVRAEISTNDSVQRYTKDLGVEVYLGRAEFTSDRTVQVNGRTLSFKKAVIATGGYPTLIPMEGLKELHEQSTQMMTTTASTPRPAVMTNETIFNLTEQPKQMIVIGAGVIGLELAQAFQRLGVTVTVTGRSGQLLPKEDDDLAQLVRSQMERDGVQFKLAVAEYKKVELTGSISDNGYPELKVTLQEKGVQGETVLLCDVLLVAAGRRPNVTGMNLEAARVEYDTVHGLRVNDKLQTTNARIFGVGDCCSAYKFTHAADFMARAVIRNALFLGKEKMSQLLIPYATFTTPEIASIGLYEQDLKQRNIPYRIIEKHFSDNDRAICDGSTVGLVRFRVDGKTDKIWGATIVGDGAGNMISEVAVAMAADMGLGRLASVIHPYPTTAEAIRQAGDVYNKTKLTTTVKILLRGIVKLQR